MKTFGGWNYLKNKIFEMPRDNVFTHVIVKRAEKNRLEKEEEH